MVKIPQCRYHFGSETSDIAFIAEAPGSAEMRADKPLVGISGMEFERLIHSAGIARAACFTGNVCRNQIEGGNEILKANKLTEKGADEVRVFHERARHLKPKVLVPMGNISLFACTGLSGITKYRGSPLPCSIEGMEHVKVIPTYHPSHIIRGNDLARHIVRSDLVKARRHVEHPETVRKSRELITDPSFDTCFDYLNECGKAGEYAADVEVYNHQISCMSFSHHPDHAISIPFYDSRTSDRHAWTDSQETALWTAIAELAYNPDLAVVGQNFIFDMFILLRNNNIWYKNKVEDLMVAHSLLFPDMPKGLDFILSIHTDEPYYKDDRKLWNKLDVAQEEFWVYSAKDAACTLEAWWEIKDDLNDGYLHTYHETIELYEILLYMMLRGVRVNRKELHRVREETDVKIQEVLRKLAEISEYEFNPFSSKQCIGYFYGTKGIPPYTNRKTGSVTTDEEALERMRKRFGLPEIALVQQARSLQKFRTAYMSVETDPDGRIRCQYNPRGTRFSRLSSSQTIFGTGMNMQNQHPHFKRFIEAG